jgi:hypothetical protein
MSFDIFFSVLERGEPASVPLSAFDAAFDGAIVQREQHDDRFVWRLAYPVEHDPTQPMFMEMNGRIYPVLAGDESDVYGDIVPGSEPARSTGFMINRPAANEALYVALLKLLQSTHSVLFWPGTNSLVIGQDATIEHLADGMVESLGEPFLVTAPGQIPERIKAS